MKRFGLSILFCAALAAGVFTGCAGAPASSNAESVSASASQQVVESAGQEGSADGSLSASAQEAADAEAGSSGDAVETEDDAGSQASAGAAESAGATDAQASGETSEGAADASAQSADGATEGAADASAQSADGASGSTSGADAQASGEVSVETLNTDELFTERDLQQEADVSAAQSIQLSDGQDVSIADEGVYVVSGTAKNCTITVEADDSAKVQLVLDGATIENEDDAAIYVKSADKVFVTTASGTTNTLSTTGTFANADDEKIDGVIYAKDDLVLNGTGTLSVSSSASGIVGKDDVKVTGGTYKVTAAEQGLKGKDSLAIADGTFEIEASKDALHAENSDDPALGYLYIADGSFKLNAGSDGISGASIVKIDGGTFDISAAEGIEGTYVQINEGMVGIAASDDGINATQKSTAYDVALEINGGATTVTMGEGDTDALDSNGDLIINGGTVDITAQFAFDFDGRGELNGGTVTVNGEQVTQLENSMMGPGGRGGQGGWGGQGDMPSDNLDGSQGMGGWGQRGQRGQR